MSKNREIDCYDFDLVEKLLIEKFDDLKSKEDIHKWNMWSNRSIEDKKRDPHPLDQMGVLDVLFSMIMKNNDDEYDGTTICREELLYECWRSFINDFILESLNESLMEQRQDLIKEGLLPLKKYYTEVKTNE